MKIYVSLKFGTSRLSGITAALTISAVSVASAAGASGAARSCIIRSGARSETKTVTPSDRMMWSTKRWRRGVDA